MNENHKVENLKMYKTHSMKIKEILEKKKSFSRKKVVVKIMVLM